MKERVFYVINLDNRRIFTLAIFLVAMLFSFFFLGLSVGKRKGLMEAYKYDTTLPGPEQKTNLATATDPSVTTSQEIVELKNQSAMIPSQEKTEIATSETTVPSQNESVKGEEESTTEPVLITTKSAKKHTKVKKSKATERYYSIQVAAFKSKDQAEKSAAKIKASSKIQTDPFIEKEGSYYMVRVGKYTKKSSANKALPEINKELKVKGMVIRKKD